MRCIVRTVAPPISASSTNCSYSFTDARRSRTTSWPTGVIAITEPTANGPSSSIVSMSGFHSPHVSTSAQIRQIASGDAVVSAAYSYSHIVHSISCVEIPIVTVDELSRKLEDGDPFVLVDALAPMVYAHSHLPGAINLPPLNVDPTVVARRIPDPHTEIVVYCANPDCADSGLTAQRLVALGYTNVRHYPGGKDEWREAG